MFTTEIERRRVKQKGVEIYLLLVLLHADSGSFGATGSFRAVPRIRDSIHLHPTSISILGLNQHIHHRTAGLEYPSKSEHLPRIN